MGKKVILALFITVLCCVSCNSEKKHFKNALKSSISEMDLPHYKLIDFNVVETILDVNLKDSIASQRAHIMVTESFMSSDSTRLKDIQRNLKDAKVSQATTLSYLRSFYNSIIRDYEEMESDIVDKINERKADIASCQERINKYETAIEESDSPIVYYKVKHSYSLRGALKDTTLTMDTKYRIINE